jgi:UDP-2,4-diacetamido-2,4,6-trideoxy-beta-L-altropyranose hydrolase
VVSDGKDVIEASDRPTIAFRVDSSSTIGSGHLRRCLGLAGYLRDLGAVTVFVCRDHPGNLNSLVTDEGHMLIELPKPKTTLGTVDSNAANRSFAYADWLGVLPSVDAEETVAAISDYKPHTIIVDHYAIDARWHGSMRDLSAQIVVIDDLANRHHDCDLLIDTAVADLGRYDRMIPAGARRMLGPRYALLRPDFSKLASGSKKAARAIERVVVAFGGVDATNVTALALDAISKVLPLTAAVDVVLGSGAPHLSKIRQQCESHQTWSLHVDTQEMAAIMSKADLAIGAAGVISWERACLGLPSIVVSIAENQHLNAEGLAGSGCALVIPSKFANEAHFEASLAMLSANAGIRESMSCAGRALVDGRGGLRVAAAILRPQISVRPATLSDVEILWHWRNDPDVRAVSLQTHPISLASHKEWFAAKLSDPESFILIGQVGAEDVGVVRYDVKDDEAHVSIQVAPAFAGAGIGSALILAGERYLVAHRPEVVSISADVLHGNVASLALFEAAGYRAYLYKLRRMIKNNAS